MYLKKNYIYSTVKPRIERSTFKSVIIKAGRTHKWSVDVIGEPPPEMTWYVKFIPTLYITQWKKS